MTLKNKNWVLQNSDPKKTVFQKLLLNRGALDEGDVLGLNNDLELHDPFLFSDMEKAINRIQKAHQQKERVIIFGDYDVDGITSTAILYQVLKRLDLQVSYRIPHRVKDGYGFTEKFLPELAEKGVKLVITVDCGISCHQTIKKASKQFGIDTIVSDHHHIPEQIPSEAKAILHPKLPNSNYPYKELTGAGVALKLAHALLIKFFPEDEEQELTKLLDLAAMGTVADLGPLLSENRAIVKRGLKSLKQTNWPGLKSLMQNASLDLENLNADSIGYQIGPRINAAGRISNPYLPLKLLLKSAGDPEINQISEQLNVINSQRADLTRKALQEAENQILKNHSNNLPEILIAEDPNWHVGIVGLVAGRLAEKYARPSIIMQEKEDLFVGSARSPEFFNITDALTELKDLLTTFGGHAQAAGFSLKKENLKIFRKELLSLAFKKLQHHDFKSQLSIDSELHSTQISRTLYDQIKTLEPFGIGNQRPIFVSRNIRPNFLKKIGKNFDHLKFSINIGKQLDAIAFYFGEHFEEIKLASAIDIAYQLDLNKWNGKENIQLRIIDIKCHN